MKKTVYTATEVVFSDLMDACHHFEDRGYSVKFAFPYWGSTFIATKGKEMWTCNGREATLLEGLYVAIREDREAYEIAQWVRQARLKRVNFGYIVGRFAAMEAERMFAHADVCAWGAPSECHADVEKRYIGAEWELELELCRKFGFTWQELCAEYNRRTGGDLEVAISPLSPLGGRIVGRVYEQSGYPF